MLSDLLRFMEIPNYRKQYFHYYSETKMNNKCMCSVNAESVEVRYQNHICCNNTRLLLSFDGRTCILFPAVLFYRDSMLVCGISLVVTFLVRWMERNQAMPPSWASGIAMKVQNSVPGQLLLSFHHPRQVREKCLKS